MHKYLDPRTLSKISRLDLKARMIVEGYMAGLHKSPFTGSSVEFKQHREYVLGDELKHIDWKLYSKTDKVYVKEFEEETNFRSQILVDVSESMLYGSKDITKMEYASYVAASLAHLILEQRDAVGMTTFSTEIQAHLAPSSNPNQLNHVLHNLNDITPTGDTGTGKVLTEIASKMSRKGIIVLISDFFDEMEPMLKGIQMLRQAGHEVIVFHILDRYEVTFPFKDYTKFVGLEHYGEELVQPQALREAYLEEINSYLETFRRSCRRFDVDYHEIITDQWLDVALTAYLSARAARGRK